MRKHGNWISLCPRQLLCVGVFFGVLATPAHGRAENQAFTLDRGALAGAIGWGSENLNLGVGGRLGYTFTPGVHLGGMFDYWFGENQTAGLPGAGEVSASASAWTLLGVAGYDFGVSPRIVIRPFGGAGVMRATGEVCEPMLSGNLTQTCIEESASTGVGVLGGHAVFDVAPLMLGAELRLLLLTSQSSNSNGNAVVTIGAIAGFAL